MLSYMIETYIIDKLVFQFKSCAKCVAMGNYYSTWGVLVQCLLCTTSDCFALIRHYHYVIRGWSYNENQR